VLWYNDYECVGLYISRFLSSVSIYLFFYREGRQICKPVCHQECGKKGDCVAPDQCKCHFGYVGQNCSTECDCNGYSMCESVEKRDTCLNCVNNTQVSRNWVTMVTLNIQTG